MLSFLLPGSRYAEREPIGLEHVIETAQRDEFLAFYRAWYRPERMIVVATATSTPKRRWDMITRHFGALAPEVPAVVELPPGVPAARAPWTRSWSAIPGLPTNVALNVVLPFDNRPDSIAKQSDGLRELLAGLMLQRRLESLGLQPGARVLAGRRWRDGFGTSGADRHRSA